LAQPCAHAAGPLERRDLFGRVPMAAIGVILLFVIFIGALNAFEFGRLD
jgi:hypothetical protein